MQVLNENFGARQKMLPEKIIEPLVPAISVSTVAAPRLALR